MNPDKWTDAEKQALRTLWDQGERGDAALAARLGRTMHGVRTQRRRLGLVLHRHVMTLAPPPRNSRYYSPSPMEDGELLLRRKASKHASRNLADAILAVFPYGHGELPSVAKSTYEWRRHRQPTLISNGSSMS